MKLILTEKPSVAKNIADALKIRTKQDGYFEGQDYVITWAFGHLLQLYDAKDYEEKMKIWKMENFPFLPTSFQYKVKSNPKNREKSDPGAAKQFKTIQRLMNRRDVTEIISACDYDREGQIIGDSIIYHKGTNKSVKRLLLNEWTEEEVLNGLQNLELNDKLRPLQDAGVSRQWADWLIGINLTSVATLKYQKGRGKALNIGRVIMPTLKIIYDRDKEIERFKPEDYFKLQATFETTNAEKYSGIYKEKQKEQFEQKAYLTEIQSSLAEKKAKIIKKEKNHKREYPPFLFNLTNLQGYITSKYSGWTSDKVLKVAQSLYEKKYITYPRTSSIALDESLVSKAAHVLSKVKTDYPFQEEIQFKKSQRVFNNQKVESHSAIIPTYVKPKSLSPDEQKVYSAIKNRFVMQFMPLFEYEETIIETKILGVELKGHFFSKGKVVLKEGWKKVEKMETKESLLPNVQLDEIVSVVKGNVTTHQTMPPKPHTEKTLLKVMETCGRHIKEDEEEVEEVLSGFSIGTPATRADTIKKLKDVGYIQTNKKTLTCTSLGKELVETFPIPQLFNLTFTGKLEKALYDMEKQQVTKQQFLSFIYKFTKESVEKIKAGQDQIIQQVEAKSSSSTDVLGKCPICQHPVIEGKKGFGCSNWKNGCKFVIWKNDKFLQTMKKKPTKTMVKNLLKDQVVYVKGLTSKNGNKFNAKLSYEKNKENDYFSWKMDF
ncbi:DNA topoisomerase [Alkalihalobacillus alcalophilus ATCC 27647 = CGMCC 1.3604]|uniref:DNA topoisomerase n=1 Tax=Alkalihalobacillus alcalophilus ATCC 27647 = CGMCC 1.3604 TaxID=1218173 RepID=A0A094WKV3_ALKAL|nr:type IA DNA topoisomerase [Alkalihalobacillus alcalophilus]KGA96578.1 DNA topoisomerase [Alkalihalobacillus alcalophilus ATCC 27647 = CGMCC 1.3604]MED1561177.1 DNA topoisomerase [Alkalihalobacillus alcalophilus]THG89262.1 DNA topoisomerase [Alkalihalobacillus alcalophilus ATCC 27647 = CGMCC 1.3604]